MNISSSNSPHEDGLPSAASNGSANGHVPRHGDETLPPLTMTATARDEPLAGTGRWDDEDQGSGVDIRQIIGMMLRHRKLMAVTFVTVVVASTIFTLLARPVYQATALMLVTSPSSMAGGLSASGNGSDISTYGQIRSLQTQISLLTKSTDLRRGAFERLLPADQKAVRDFANTDVKPEGDTNIVDITTQSHSPTAAANLANAICKEFFQQTREQNQSQISNARDYVGGQLDKVRVRLNNARTALKDYKQTNHITDLGPETTQRISQVGSIESAQQDAETERVAAEARLSRLRADMARIAPNSVVPASIRRSPAVEAIKGQLTSLELQRLALLQEYTPGSPKVQKIEGQIASTRDQLQRQSQTEVASWQPNPVQQAIAADIAKEQGTLWSVEARKAALDAAAGRARGELSKLPQREYELSGLLADRATLEQTYQTLNEKYQTLLINENGQTPNGQIVSWATVPGAPVSPQKGRNLAMAIVAGLMLAIALAALAEWMDDRVHSEQDVETATRLPILAEIPFIKDEVGQLLLGNTERTSPLLESFRMLRANITFSGVDEPVRSLCVTSSQPHEGKSTTALNLAIVMALSGKRVVLVDADLRRPSVHKLLGLPNMVGFTNVVAGMAPLSEALQPTPVAGLRVLTSGRVPPNPPELLDSRAGRSVLRQVMEDADFVVLDTPPALALADTQIVATIADAVVLVVSFQDAGKREVAKTRDLLAQTGTKLLGTILNKLSDDVSGYYGYYGSYKYRYYTSYLQPEDEPEAAPEPQEAQR